jgi:hypothetical protein
MTTTTTKLKATKRPLKIIPIKSEVKPLILSQVSSIFSASPVISLSNVSYKGQDYLMVVKEEDQSLKPKVKLYKELKKLKEFLGRGNKDLENFSTSLCPRYIKRQMIRALGECRKAEVRSLYRFDDKNPHRIQRLRSNVSSHKAMLYEIKNDWQYSAEGRKAERREDARKVYTKRKRIFGEVIAEMSAGVHLESGVFLKAHKEKITKILDFNKKPMTAERHVGLELEFMLPYKVKADVKAALVHSPYANMLCLGRDGSVTSNADWYGAELKICAPVSQVNDVVQYVAKVLAQYKCQVDKSCGFHVHLDARNDDAKLMFDKLLDQQSSLFALVPSSRRDNEYCRHTAKKDFRRGSRYKSINSTSLSKFQTLEVRLHGGTIDAKKITSWVNLLTAIAYGSTDITRSRSVKTMLAKLPLDESTKSYLSNRAALFASHGSVVRTNDDE